MARKTTDKPRRSGAPAQPGPPAPVASASDGGMRGWHLLLVATVAWAAAAAARTVAPLVTPDIGEQTEMVAGRTRAALEREKMLVLRSIKEVEFDRAMGKISVADFDEVAGRLRARAAGLLRQLDADSTGYRALIERELATRVGRAPAATAPAEVPPPVAAAGACPSCGTEHDADARFCKACGARIEAAR